MTSLDGVAGKASEEMNLQCSQRGKEEQSLESWTEWNREADAWGSHGPGRMGLR